MTTNSQGLETTKLPSASTRLPGAILIVGLLVFITGAATGFLAPSLRDHPPFVATDMAAAAAAIAGNPGAWQWANGLIIAAAVITALGLAAITVRFRERSRPWSLAGLVAFVMAAVLQSISRLITIGVDTWAAQQYPDPTVQTVYEAFDRVHLGTTSFILAFVAVSLYGMAINQAGLNSGRVFVVLGFAGILLEVVGAAIPAYVYLTTAALGVATWQLDFGRAACR